MEEKTVLITGTSSGFGFLTALSCAERGWRVIAGMRDTTKKFNLIQSAMSKGLQDKIKVIPLDVTSEEDIEKAADLCESQFGQLDALINNAGFAMPNMTELLDLQDYRDQFEVNFFGTVQMTQTFLPLLRLAKGKIINISSISGEIGFPGLSAYAASKHALEGFTESLRYELKPFDVDVVLIQPGSFQTGIWQKGARHLEQSGGNGADSLYKGMVETLSGRQLENGAFEDPENAVQVIVNALENDFPKLRYPAGKKAGVMLALKKLLPWRLWEHLVMKKIQSK